MKGKNSVTILIVSDLAVETAGERRCTRHLRAAEVNSVGTALAGRHQQRLAV